MNPKTKIYHNGVLIHPRPYKRNRRGEFVPKGGIIARTVAHLIWFGKTLTFIIIFAAFVSFIGAFFMPSDVLYVHFDYPTAKAEERIAPRTILDRIADCESGGGKPGSAHQFNKDGSVVMNPVTNDVGYFQINMSREHIRESTKLGYNVLTEDGNRAYAEYLFEHYGTSPWDSSKKCWART